jgi:basic membrane protein A
MSFTFAYFRAVFFSSLMALIPSSAWAFKVGLILDKGGKDDKSFNSSAFEGATKAKKDLGIELKYVEAMDINALESLLRSFSSKEYDLIIGIGFGQADAMKKIAAQFPQRKFAIVDAEVEAPNVRSLVFEEQEGSYIVGAIAGMKSKTGKVGFIGGMDIPMIRRFEMGFSAGLKKMNPKAKLVSNFIGITGDAWNNPAKAKELALSQYNSGIDIVFVAAGASGAGVFDAAEETNKLAIGVDSNQDWVKPGFILTSMLKRVDVAVYDTIKEAQQGHFAGGIFHYGLKNHGVDYSLDSYNAKLLDPETLKKEENLKTQIIAGKIHVPDFYKNGGK